VSPARDLFRAVQRYLRDLDYPPHVRAEGVELPLSTGQRLALPIPPVPELDESERLVMDVFWSQDRPAPLQQKQLARASRLSLSTIRRVTPRLIDKGLLRHHPALGFYVPGTDLPDVGPDDGQPTGRRPKA
jgi:hypothetical protein